MTKIQQRNIDSEKLNYTVREACTVIGFSRTKMWELEKAGRIVMLRLGSKVLVPLDELLKLQGELFAEARLRLKSRLA